MKYLLMIWVAFIVVRGSAYFTRQSRTRRMSNRDAWISFRKSFDE
jgi:hypothetical protein